MLKKILLSLLLACLLGNAYAQYESLQNTASTPNTQGQKNLDVDLFRGKHRIDIPIFNFQTKHLSMPVSLDYTPIDIQADKVRFHQPGDVGLGWALTCGGIISRTVNTIPDETAKTGNFYNTDQNFFPIQNSSQLLYHEAGEDEFDFSFCGYSGKFLFCRGKWVFSSDVDFAVTTQIAKDELGKNVLKKITLVAPDGTAYTFGGTNAVEDKESVSNSQFNSAVATTWHLTKVESAEGDRIDLEYELGDGMWCPATTQTTLVTNSCFRFLNGSDSCKINVDKYPSDADLANLSAGYRIRDCRLSKISSPTNPVSIQFNTVSYTRPASGYYSGGEVHKLDNIVLLSNSDGEEYKKFQLAHDNGNTLLLTSVTEWATTPGQTASALPPYRFTYLEESDLAAPCVLKKVTYPTGGYTAFEFEQQRYCTYPNGQSFYVGYSQSDLSMILSNNGLTPTSSDTYFFVENKGLSEESGLIPQVNTTAGFRIRKQTSKGADGDDAEVLEYFSICLCYQEILVATKPVS
jgi:hypothetical protein